jgi:acyl-CoA reductase-like NAD-dependent aldehyde dehydrogenase
MSGISRAEIVPIDPTHAVALPPVPQTLLEDLEGLVATARAALAGEWRHNGRLRAGALLAWAEALEREASALVEQLIRETGKIRREAEAEVRGAVDSLRYNAGLARYVGGRAGHLPDGSIAHLQREPIGPTLFITPWNWPVLLLLRDLAPALAAGVTAIVKPAPQTSAVTASVMELAAGAIPDGVLGVAFGGAETGQRLLTHPDVAGVAFTGSSATGRTIAQAAATTFKRTLLELGGKGVSVVFADAEVEKAVQASARSAMTTSGQMCMACTRLLVEESAAPLAREVAVETLRTFRVGDPSDPATDLGPLISESHRARVLEYVTQARQSAHVVSGGNVVAPDGLPGWFLAPCLVEDVAPTSPIVQDEIFGPLLTLEVFADEEEAVRLANTTPYGLAGAVWTQEPQRAWRVADSIRAGTVWVNTYGGSYAEMPSGGYGASGLGRTRGIEGIEQFTELKHINWAPDRPRQPA